jgi:hypothetical protein
MNAVPAEAVLREVAAQRQVILEQQGKITSFSQGHLAERTRLESARAAAAVDLGKALLPRLDPRAIATAASVTGLLGLPAEDLPGKLEARRHWLVSRLQEISRNPNFRDRELLRHPRTGSLVRALNEAEDYRNVANEIVVLCESHPRFERLMSTGYGTPLESGSFWRYSYWQDRSAASEITAKCRGKTEFKEVREAYESAKDTVAVYDADIARLRGQIAAGEALSREHAALCDEHRTLDARALEFTQGRLVRHLLEVDGAVASQRLRATRSSFLPLFLRASGIAAKIEYLDGIAKTNIDTLQRELAEQRVKLDAVETRTRRKWAPMPRDKFEKFKVDRRPRFEKRWQRFGKVYTTVSAYDRWNRARYYDDFLWWDLMTRGRYDGSYIHSVAAFHQHHPGYEFDPDWQSRAAAYEASSAARRVAHDDVSTEPDDAGADDRDGADTADDAGADDRDGDAAAEASARADAGGAENDTLVTSDAS